MPRSSQVPEPWHSFPAIMYLTQIPTLKNLTRGNALPYSKLTASQVLES